MLVIVLFMFPGRRAVHVKNFIHFFPFASTSYKSARKKICRERLTFQANSVLFIETLLNETIQRAFLPMELENKFINVIPGGHHLSDKFQTTGCLA